MNTANDKKQRNGEILSGNCAPILLLGFNRPGLLEGLVAILAKARPPTIYLAVDGPRPDRPGEAEKCAKCAAVDIPAWPCEIHKLIRAENLGCKRAVEEALDWFFSQEEKGIVLEDDCWPDLSFLRYATELLNRYQDDDRVGIVSGDNFYGFITDPDASYRFSCHVHIWGWATWARVWRCYRTNPEEFFPHVEEVIQRTNLTLRGRTLYRRYWEGFAARRDTWDVPFSLWLQSHDALNAMPRRNLVANKGYGGGDGTHTQGFAYDQALFARAETLAFPISHAAAVERDILADRLHERRSFAWIPRILTIVGLHFGAVGRALCAAARQLEKAFPVIFRL